MVPSPQPAVVAAALTVLLCASGACAAEVDADAAKLKTFRAPSCKFKNAEKARTAYEFSTDWFTPNAARWKKLFGHLADRPLRYLEIGVFEGRSLVFMLDNVLKHPASQAVGVDIKVADRYLRNLARSGRCAKVANYEGPSQSVLKYLPARSFDIIYIDGGHTMQAVLGDALLAFDALKNDGFMIFDDYLWVPDLPDDLRPNGAINAFVTAFQHRLEVVYQGYQLVVRKKPHPCHDAPGGTPAGDFMTSPVGKDYCYHWAGPRKLTGRDGKPVPLSKEETLLIEKLAHRPRFGDNQPLPEMVMNHDPAFRELNARLKLYP
jgi:predicted O-methyltransferase YrrM